MLRPITAVLLVALTTGPGLTHAIAETPAPCGGVHVVSSVWILNQDQNTCADVPPPAPAGMECLERGAEIPPPGTLDVYAWICIPE